MDSFWAGFGWIIGGLAAMATISIVALFVLFAISKWMDDDKK